jgi:thiosulfate dehydrogenase [quinone] large subunit
MKTSTSQSFIIQKPGWILIPLRLFLGITFIYAGLQKLTDPQFFNPTAAGYIGKQIAAFATGSPLHDFLVQVTIPHAYLFGILIAYGELAIGVGTILGFLLRPAAFFGMLISLMFFLTATWRVRPYFYGSDIVFFFGWLTLLIAGPAYTGLPTLDAIIAPRLLSLVSSERRRTQLARVLGFIVGIGETPKPVADTQISQPLSTGKQTPAMKRQQQARLLAEQAKKSRRNFLMGALTGGAGVLGLVWLWNTLHLFPGDAPVNTGTGSTTAAGAGTATTSGTPSAGSAIAQVSAVQNNSSVTFTIPSNNDPGILVRLNNGQFVAYDATCTHAGCPVDYDPSSQLLICPCHGAEFDPSKSAAVVQGPAQTPLTSVSIKVDNTSGAITISQ